jgi:siroheme synthase
MGVEHRSTIGEQLLEGGLSKTTPVAIVERAWTGQQRTTRGQLQDLGNFDVRPPAVIVVGEVAALDLRSIGVLDVALL